MKPFNFNGPLTREKEHIIVDIQEQEWLWKELLAELKVDGDAC